MSWHPATLGPLSLPSFFIGRGDFFYSTDGQGKIRGKNRKNNNNNNNNKGEDGQWRGGSSSSFHLRASAYKQQTSIQTTNEWWKDPASSQALFSFQQEGPTNKPTGSQGDFARTSSSSFTSSAGCRRQRLSSEIHQTTIEHQGVLCMMDPSHSVCFHYYVQFFINDAEWRAETSDAHLKMEWQKRRICRRE